MKAQRIIRLASARAARRVWAWSGGLATTGASAAPAQTFPADQLPVIYPAQSNTGQLPPPGTPGTKIDASCPSWLFASAVGLQFTSGSAVLYRIPPGAPPGVSNGGNAQGNAMLMLGTSPADQTPSFSGYQGHTHLWFGQNSNANGHSYFGETIAFDGTAPDGTSISIHGNPGSNTSASGHTNGWGQLTVRCS